MNVRPAGAGLSPLGLALVLSATAVGSIDAFITFVAAPTIGAELGASSDELQWIVAAYGLTFSLGLITGGRLGDLYGRRRTLVVGMLAFGVASGACGAAPDPTSLILFRCLQGAGAALMLPQVFSIVQVEFPPAQRGRPLALVGGVQGIAAVTGQLLGGALLALDPLNLGWRSVFLINLPICAVGVLFIPRFVPESRSAAARHLDLGGVALAALVVAALAVPLVQGRAAGWPPWTFLSFAAVLPLGLVFVLWEGLVKRGGGSPLVEFGLFRAATFRLGLGLSLFFMLASPPVILLLMIYLQEGLGLSAIDAGLTFTPAAIAYALAALGVGRMGIARREHALVPGIAVTAGGVLLSGLLVALVAEPSPLLLALTFVIVGAGQGAVIPAMTGTVLAETDPLHAGSASGLLATTMQLGGALGIALTGTVFFGHLGSATSAAAYGEAFAIALGAVLAILAIAGALGRRVYVQVNPGGG
ncbi:MAG: MFS transporter [Actinobacteria bacterium]|nr:MFS transporter [Actinomycetota bacterium]